MTGSHPNIVLVSMDSLRGDHCGHLGSDASLTPTMDSLAAKGISYQNAVAPGAQTFSSMPAAFTGTHRSGESLESYPGETHWERRLAAIEDHMHTHPSLPERLQQAGYSTGAVTPNPWTSTATGFDRGFDTFGDLSNEAEDGRVQRFLAQIPGVDTDDRAVELAINMTTGSSFFSKWVDIYADIERVRAQLSEPYFLWIFLLDTHFPFLCSRTHRAEQTLPDMYYSAYKSEKQMRGRDDATPMSESLEQSVRRSYRDTVRASDAFLERFLADNSEDDPVTIVHADHGESFGEHGNYGHHHRELYDENVHVPFFLHNAGSSASIADPISLTQLPEMVLALAEDGTLDPKAHTAEYVVAESECGTHRAVRDEQFKYIESGNEQLLFDLSRDPQERRSVAADHPERCDTAQRVLREFDATRAERTRLQHRAQSLVTSGTL